MGNGVSFAGDGSQDVNDKSYRTSPANSGSGGSNMQGGGDSNLDVSHSSLRPSNPSESMGGGSVIVSPLDKSVE